MILKVNLPYSMIIMICLFHLLKFIGGCHTIESCPFLDMENPTVGIRKLPRAIPNNIMNIQIRTSYFFEEERGGSVSGRVLDSGLKITHLRKSVFWSAFGFSNIAFTIPSHFIIVPYFMLWMLDLFNIIQLSNSLDPSGSKLFAKVISSQQTTKVAPSGQIQNNRLILPWLKLISFHSNFFHLAKVLATANFEPGLALPD